MGVTNDGPFFLLVDRKVDRVGEQWPWLPLMPKFLGERSVLDVDHFHWGEEIPRLGFLVNVS